MRLLMISGAGASSLAEGKHGAFYNTLEEFHKHWDRVDIICPKIFNEISTLKPIIRFDNVFIHPSPWPLVMQPWWILKKGTELWREHKLDLVTAHEYPPFYNGIGVRLLWGRIKVPYVLEIHHVTGYPRAADFKERLYKIATRLFVKHDAAKAKMVRVVNRHQVPDFLVKAGVPANKIKYIPSVYIDLETFQPMPEVEKRYDLVFAGRLEKNKNIGGLIEAIKIVKNSKPDINLLVIGSGPERENLKSQISNLKLEDNVFFSGWLETSEDVVRAYNSARIFINPSLNEGGPRVVLEAMACGLPVITTRVGLMPDIIKNAENGFLVDWNQNSMADKITHLLNSINLQKQFSSVGLESVKQYEKKSAIKNWADELKLST